MLLFIPLDILSRLLQSNVYLTVILYTIAQLLLLVIGMILVQKQIFGENRFSQIFTIQVFTLCLILIATTKSYFFTYLFMSSFHVSVLIVLVFATVQMLRIMQPQSTVKVRMRSLLLLFALIFLTSLSDTLCVIQFVVPALVASLAWLKRERMAWRRLLQM